MKTKRKHIRARSSVKKFVLFEINLIMKIHTLFVLYNKKIS